MTSPFVLGSFDSVFTEVLALCYQNETGQAPGMFDTGRGGRGQASQTEVRASACSMTVSAAFSCLSGGYPCLRRIRLTAMRSRARTSSRRVQSMPVLERTVSTSSRAIMLSTSSPITATALSLVSRAS